jgi:integrase
MATLHMTETALQRLGAPAKGKKDYQDDEVKHLYLRVSPASRRWYHVRSVTGRVVWKLLGQWPDVTVAAARRRAAELNGQDRQTATRRDLTLGGLWERYWRTRVEGRLKTAKALRGIWTIYLEPHARERLVALGREDVAAMHREWGRTHGETSANRAVELLRACLSWGLDMELIDRNPAKKVEKFKERSRERFLDGAELCRLFAALDQLPDRQWADFFALALYTGQRRANVCAMAWADVDLVAGAWSIPGETTKNGDQLRLPLAKAALEILERRHAGSGRNPWVFPGRGTAGHVTNPSKAWAVVRKLAKLEDVRLHDLRRTLGSWQAAQGASMLVIGKSLGHKSQQATEVYARLDLDPVRASVDAAVDAMQAQVQNNAEASQKRS